LQSVYFSLLSALCASEIASVTATSILMAIY